MSHDNKTQADFINIFKILVASGNTRRLKDLFNEPKREVEDTTYEEVEPLLLPTSGISDNVDNNPITNQSNETL